MSTSGLVCWSCRTLNDETDSTCANCGAGLTAGGRDMTPKQFRTEQAQLRRKLGMKQTLEEIELELESLPEGQDMAWRTLKERKQIEQLRQTLSEQRSSLLPQETPPPIVQEASSPSLRGTPQIGRRPPISVPCTKCGHSSSDPVTVFCPKCGERVIDEDTEMVTRRMVAILNANLPDAVRREVADLERKVIRLEQQAQHQSHGAFSWNKVSSDEKWNLTWGVWGRQILVNVALMVGLFLILGAMAGLFGN